MSIYSLKKKENITIAKKKHTMIKFNCLFGGFLHFRDLKGTIEQKGMTFDHDFGYSFPLFSALLNKRE